MTTHTISVVIPCYNASRYLTEALTSVMQQSYPPIEIIVIDDGSTDDSADVATNFDSQVRVIRQSNQGESVARNRGLEEARGEWIAFLDADDLWDATKLEKQISLIDNETLAVCTGNYVLEGDKGKLSEGIWWLPRADMLTADFIIGVGAPVLPSSLLVRATLASRFPTWTKYSEDALFLLDLIREGPIRVVSERLVVYREHSESQSCRNRDIEVRRHASIDQWISQHSDITDANERERLRALALNKLIRLLDVTYWNRDWTRFDVFCAYLKTLPNLPQQLGTSRLSRFPRWCYWLKDGIDALIGRKSSGPLPMHSLPAQRTQRPDGPAHCDSTLSVNR